MNPDSVERGFTIAELLLVIAVMAIVAATAIPSISDVHVRRLNAASAEVVNALSYARQESLRTGVAHGVRAYSGKLLVFRMDTTADPAIEIYDVKHPVDRAADYKFDLNDSARTSATSIQGHFEIYKNATPQQAISFDARGEPVDGVTGLPLIGTHGGFVLTNGERGTYVSVARISGRVEQGNMGAPITDPATVF